MKAETGDRSGEWSEQGERHGREGREGSGEDVGRPTNQRPEATPSFQKRTFDFGIRCIRLIETLPKTMVARTLGKQLLRSATSVGANYRAAQRGRSRADFIAKMGLVEEECDESLYWIEMLVELGLARASLVAPLRQEANELISITVSSIKTARLHSRLPKRS
jgi:four helix bundle protein